MGLGVAIGAGVGAVMASAYGSEYLAIGIGAGLAIGGGLEAYSRRNNDNDEDGETCPRHRPTTNEKPYI